MNKKGQTAIVALMLTVMLFMTIIILTDPLKDTIDIGRDSSHLDCNNASISTGTKLTCLTVDLTLFYFVGMVIALIGGLILKAKFT